VTVTPPSYLGDMTLSCLGAVALSKLGPEASELFQGYRRKLIEN
jgi:hypothetical protein